MPPSRLRRHPSRCPRRTAGRAPWIPHSTSAPMGAVAIAAGSDGAICAPMAIPMAAPGANSSAPREGYFPEHHGTIFHGKHAAVELIVRVLACLAEGLGIRATARVFEVDANTVLSWLVEAAEQLRAFSAYFLCDLHLEQLQLDELYAVLRDLKAGTINDDEAIKRLARSPYWVWTAMDPKSKLLVVVDVGNRTLAMAQRVVHQVTRVLVPGTPVSNGWV